MAKDGNKSADKSQWQDVTKILKNRPWQDVSKITEKSPWQEITEGNKIYAAGTSVLFHTGEWRTSTPIFDEEKCTQCLLCAPVCPDSSIPVVNGERGEFDLDHCKGCGICAKVCPFDAIIMKEGQ